MKTMESTKGKSTRFHISIQISNNRSSHIRILSFQGENEEAMKGADGKDVKHSIKGSPGSSQLSWGKYCPEVRLSIPYLGKIISLKGILSSGVKGRYGLITSYLTTLLSDYPMYSWIHHASEWLQLVYLTTPCAYMATSCESKYTISIPVWLYYSQVYYSSDCTSSERD